MRIIVLDGGRYAAAIEPHHGHELVVYTAPEKPDDLWRRRVLRTRKGGHTLATADLGGGGDSLLVGFVAEPLWTITIRPAGRTGCSMSREWRGRTACGRISTPTGGPTRSSAGGNR